MVVPSRQSNLVVPSRKVSTCIISPMAPMQIKPSHSHTKAAAFGVRQCRLLLLDWRPVWDGIWQCCGIGCHRHGAALAAGTSAILAAIGRLRASAYTIALPYPPRCPHTLLARVGRVAPSRGAATCNSATRLNQAPRRAATRQAPPDQYVSRLRAQHYLVSTAA